MSIASTHIDTIETGQKVRSKVNGVEGRITEKLLPFPPFLTEETLFVIRWDNGEETVREQQDLDEVELLE
jgi:hypothetical protein